MLLRRRAVGNTVSDLTDLRFEPQTSRSRDECVTAGPPGQFMYLFASKLIWLFADLSVNLRGDASLSISNLESISVAAYIQDGDITLNNIKVR